MPWTCYRYPHDTPSGGGNRGAAQAGHARPAQDASDSLLQLPGHVVLCISP